MALFLPVHEQENKRVLVLFSVLEVLVSLLVLLLFSVIITISIISITISISVTHLQNLTP